jgi:hypothetical protein
MNDPYSSALSLRATALASAACALVAVGCAGTPTIDWPWADLVQVGAFNESCRLAEQQDEGGALRFVHVVCNEFDRPPGESVRAGLEERFAYSFIPNGPHEVWYPREGVAAYTFYIDTGERPLLIYPRLQTVALRNLESVSCVAIYDIRQDGATTNICTQCEGRGGDAIRAYESATKNAVSTWLFEPAAAGAEDRRAVRSELSFMLQSPGAPAAPAEGLTCNQPGAD